MMATPAKEVSRFPFVSQHKVTAYNHAAKPGTHLICEHHLVFICEQHIPQPLPVEHIRSFTSISGLNHNIVKHLASIKRREIRLFERERKTLCHLKMWSLKCTRGIACLGPGA